jgi:tRNA threonylcarbamoyladenosine biosynthesis protein TsaB
MLLLDASTPFFHAGVIEGGKWLSFERCQGDAVTLLPAMAERALHNGGVDLADIKSLLHCEGPGSLLGLRLCAMMMETWRVLPETAGAKLFSYRSLSVAAAVLSITIKENFVVTTQFRKGSYCVFASDGTDRGVCEESELPAQGGNLYVIPQKNQKTLPSCSKCFEYDIAPLPTIIAAKPMILAATSKATAFSPHLSEYKLWDGRRHSAPEN